MEHSTAADGAYDSYLHSVGQGSGGPIATAIPGPVTPRSVSSWASVTGPLTVISSLLIEIFMQVYEIKVKTVGDDGLDGKINQHANYRNRYPASRKTGKR